jgi:ornithine cyclodeaminase/alanine dehydrogenase-like protein (mu-crystallin family)
MGRNKLLFLSGSEVRELVTMKEVIGVMGKAFSRLSSGEAQVPLRTGISVRETGGTGLFMPVYSSGENRFGLKAVTVFKGNPDKGLPMVHALVLIMNGETGEPEAVMDGEVLTALRTGAASGLATDLLSRRDSTVAAVIGTGTQGLTQLEAVSGVRPLEKVILIDRERARAEAFIAQAAEKLNVSFEIAVDTGGLREADIICTATSSSVPVFRDSDLKDGTHINGVGSYKPDMAEVPGETVVRAKVFADEKGAVLSEAGDLIQALSDFHLEPVHPPLFDVLNR